MSAFTVISEPSRRRLMDLLLDGPKPVSTLVADIGMSQPVVSKHLRVLRDAGLVSVTPDGQRRLYSINPQPLAEVDEWLDPYRRFWSEKLAALEKHLDSCQAEEER